MKEIQIMKCDLEFSNPYVEFIYGDILYRWYLNEDGFSKLFDIGTLGNHGKAVRGNERKEVFEQLKKMVEEIKETRAEKVISIKEKRSSKEMLETAIDKFMKLTHAEKMLFADAMYQGNAEEMARITTRRELINNEIPGVNVKKYDLKRNIIVAELENGTCKIYKGI